MTRLFQKIWLLVVPFVISHVVGGQEETFLRKGINESLKSDADKLDWNNVVVYHCFLSLSSKDPRGLSETIENTIVSGHGLMERKQQEEESHGQRHQSVAMTFRVATKNVLAVISNVQDVLKQQRVEVRSIEVEMDHDAMGSRSTNEKTATRAAYRKLQDKIQNLRLKSIERLHNMQERFLALLSESETWKSYLELRMLQNEIDDLERMIKNNDWLHQKSGESSLETGMSDIHVDIDRMNGKEAWWWWVLQEPITCAWYNFLDFLPIDGGSIIYLACWLVFVSPCLLCLHVLIRRYIRDHGVSAWILSKIEHKSDNDAPKDK